MEAHQWARWRVAGYGMTLHAAERMVEMDVSIAQVEDAIVRPDIAYDQPNYGPGARIFKKGPISVATGDGRHGPVVKTILWNTQAQYGRE